MILDEVTCHKMLIWGVSKDTHSILILCIWIISIVESNQVNLLKQHIQMMDDSSHTTILIVFFPPLIEVWVPKLSCLIRLSLHFNLLMEVKTSAWVVWQQQCSSSAQRMEARKVLIVSLSVTWKIKREFTMSKEIYANRSWNSPVPEQKISKPQNLVNITSYIFTTGNTPFSPQLSLICLAYVAFFPPHLPFVL